MALKPSPIAKPGASIKAPKVLPSQGGHGPVFKGSPKPAITPKAPKASKITQPKTLASSAPPADPVMDVFRSTLAQMKALQTPVDAAAIRAPYDAAMGVTTNLGDAWARAAGTEGQAAQDQYQGARSKAQSDAAAYGISAGAPASSTALVDPATEHLAAQTAANQAAAHGAAAAWADMLNRTAGATVSKAQQAQVQQNSQNEQSLAASLPGAYQARDTLAFQKQTAQQNNDYLQSTLTEKQREAMATITARERGQNITARGQDIAATTASKGQAAQDARLTRSIAAAKQHDKTTQKGLNTRAQRAAKRTNNNAGISQILSVLKPTAGKSQKEPAGWIASVQTIDPSTGQAYGNIMSLPVKDVRESQQGMPGAVPKTFKIVGAKAATKTVMGASQGITLAQWNKAVGIAMTTRGLTKPAAQAFIQGLTPRPSK